MGKPSSIESLVDTNNQVPITLGTAIAGEDLTNDVLKTEQRFSYANITLAAPTTTTVKSGAGFLHSITVNTPAATGTITITDGPSGAAMGIITSIASAPYTVILDVSFTVGLVIVTATAAQNITVSYR